MICINCLKKGHIFKNCMYPITSYGIIGYRIFYNKFTNKNELKYVLVQRKNTMGYIDFIRGKYDTEKYRIEGIYRNLLEEMTIEEKKNLLQINNSSRDINEKFDNIWDNLWLNKNSRIYKLEYKFAKEIYNSIDIETLIKDTINESKWNETEYSIPKGRRNSYEHVIDCALREFIEETGIKMGYIELIDKLEPIEEIFFGSNGIAYRHVYYIAKIHTHELPKININNVSQAGEVKNIRWCTYKETMNIFRNYETTRRSIIYQVNKFLQKKYSLILS